MTQAEDFLEKAIGYQRMTSASYTVARRYMRFGPKIRAIQWQHQARSDFKLFEYYLSAAMLARKQNR